MNMTPRIFTRLGLTALLAFSQPCLAAEEITYPGEAFAKLDTFEGLNLEDADKLFAKADYKGAYAAYKAYSFEFAKSKALPYVLLRMGRCLHKLEKRNAAITAYQDVVDYFPDDVRNAAAALYHIGECHGENGEEAKQTATWARMVKDDGYVTQPNSGTALTFLGTAMEKLGKFDEAAQYHWRTAVAFLKTNPKAAQSARAAVLAHHALRSPNHDKLAEFYIAASGFDGQGRDTGKPEEDARYWSAVFDTILRASGESQLREKAAVYWGAKFGDRLPDNDPLRKQWADVQAVHEKDRASWLARMEKQFASKPATLDRVLQWCEWFKPDPDMRSKFFAKQSAPFLAALKTPEKMALMNRLRQPLDMHAEAQTVMRSVRTDGMTDEEFKDYAMFLANYQPEEEVLRLISRMKDRLFATKARYDYYISRSSRNPPYMEKALAEIPELLKSPKYAEGLPIIQARLLQNLGRHEEAIKAYNAANVQPESTWGVADSQTALKQYDQAVKTVKELEAVGGAVAARASLKAADIYRISGDKGREVTQLRQVLKRYPKSGESSEAHNRLESYGVALSGGEAEAED
ncbi:tetratricopeptide repeat protein [Akkermansiaceae bacterium]|nr:tetratricopeptide repeat protein [Akkermansiaceae bacterium]